MARKPAPKLRFKIDASVNGRVRTATVTAFDAETGKRLEVDKADLMSEVERNKLVGRLAKKLRRPPKKLKEDIEAAWYAKLDEHDEAEARAARGEPPREGDPAPVNEESASAATLLIRLVENARAELFHEPDGTAYARMQVGDHHEVWPLRQSGFRRWLKRLYYGATGKAPGSQAVEDALGVLEGRAAIDGPEHQVNVRVAEHGGRIYLDLGQPDWQVVEIAPGGWRVMFNPPVRFRRTKGTLSLPTPAPGGTLDLLRSFLNLPGRDARDASDASSASDSWDVLIAWITAALRGRGPYPLMVLSGEQGTCKSNFGRYLQRLIDPNMAGLRSEPREPRDLMIAARNAWVVAYDNLSHLPQWLSDALCRLSTGGGFGTRQLYTDDEEVLFSAQRPALLTSIEDVVTAGDALDRAIALQLEYVPEECRRTEEELDAAFDTALPRILGALLDAVAGGLKMLPSVSLDRKPRMADFARWGEAVLRGLGFPPGHFLDAYQRNRAGVNEVALEASPIVAPLRLFLAQQLSGSWRGTAGELYEALTKLAGDALARSKEWPKKPHVLSGCLTRLAPNLRRAGILFERDRVAGGKRSRFLCLRRIDPPNQNRGATERPERPGASQDGGKDAPDSSCARDAPDSPSVPEASRHKSGQAEDLAASRDARDAPSPSRSCGDIEEDGHGDAWEGGPEDDEPLF
jgi:hypothetical protein